LAYLAAFLSGLRPARWYGTRLLPLVGSFFALLLANLLVQLFGSWVPVCAVAILYLVFLWLIIHVARTRDYS
jgi:hypothetical protein